ncbi:transcriptional regulator, partial [Klebsiella pneumoniae]|nr:transcriptional regulator [Klebsiella pneumoniae]
EILNATLNRNSELATQILAEHINRSLIAVQKLPKERFGK